MNATELKQQDHASVAQTYGRFDLVLSHGKGSRVWDSEGKAYLDFTSGIGTNSLGFADEKWLEAVCTQAGKLAHVSNLYYSVPYIQLAEKLTARSGMQRVFFGNSGAEANEGAIKCARKYSHDKYGDNRATILSLVNSFHGRTVSTLAATGQAVFHQHFFPFTDGFEHVPANDIDALTARLAQGDVCAVMFEIVQGEGGINALEADYVQALVSACRAQDVLVIVDEVQTGIGRTGTLFSFQQFGFTPDICTLAKGLGGGLPIGAVLFNEKTADVFGKSDHGSTFGGNPVSCAAANAVLDRIDEAFLAQVQANSALLCQGLMTLPKVKSVSGLGLMLGIEFEDGIVALDIVKKAMEKGLLTLTAKHKLRLLPPLIINEADIAECLAILNAVLSE